MGHVCRRRIRILDRVGHLSTVCGKDSVPDEFANRALGYRGFQFTVWLDGAVRDDRIRRRPAKGSAPGPCCAPTDRAASFRRNLEYVVPGSIPGSIVPEGLERLFLGHRRAAALEFVELDTEGNGR